MPSRLSQKNLVDAYIARYPAGVQRLLEQIRTTVRKAAPGAEEGISYGIPAYRYQGSLVWFAAFKNHVGFYPKHSGIANFKKELLVFKNAKGSVQFPIGKPLPLNLVARIVKFRVKENKEIAKSQKKKGDK